MITIEHIRRYRKNKRGIVWLEVTEPGQKADWVDKHHVYYHLGMVREED